VFLPGIELRASRLSYPVSFHTSEDVTAGHRLLASHHKHNVKWNTQFRRNSHSLEISISKGLCCRHCSRYTYPWKLRIKGRHLSHIFNIRNGTYVPVRKIFGSEFGVAVVGNFKIYIALSTVYASILLCACVPGLHMGD